MRGPDVQNHDETNDGTGRCNDGGDPNDGRSTRLFVWSPTDPNQLFHSPVELNAYVGSEVEEAAKSLKFEAALAEGGDCNEFEHKALTRILDEYSRCFSDETDGEKFAKIQSLADQSVLLVRECVDEWVSSRQERHRAWVSEASARADGVSDDDAMMKEAEGEDDADDEENLMMLKWTYGVVSLSSVYLRFLSPCSPLNRAISSSVVGMQLHPLDYPGLVSSDLVRFLREVYPYLKEQDPQQVPDSLNPLQLRQDEGCSMQDSASEWNIDWKEIRNLVISGSTVRAWEIMRRHSIYRDAQQYLNVIGEDASHTEHGRFCMGTVHEFETAGILLLLAPLPGGRAVANDNAIDDMILTFSDGASSMVSDLDSSDGEAWDKEYDGYSHQEAARKHQRWQQIVVESLRRRKSDRRSVVIPELDDLLQIMSGDFRGVRFESWGEELCATILYQKPYGTPIQLAQCAEDIILRSGDARMSSSDRVPPFVTKALVSLMNGNVEDGIGFLSTMGSASMAALPSTITALLYTMYLEASVTSSQGEVSDMLCQASTSILSTIEPQHSTYLAIQLLMPFALRDGADELVGTIASILELHDSDDRVLAERIIEICGPLIQHQAADVLDGCCSLILSCYRSLMSFEQLADGVCWLRKGIELETTVLPTEIRPEGSCYRTLAALCYQAAQEIADEFLARTDFMNQDATFHVLDRAELILEGLGTDMDIASTIPAIRTLRSFLVCCRGSSSLQERADQLIICFQSAKRSGDLVLRSFAPSCLHWTLLQMARKLILKAAELSSADNAHPLCVFDAAGIALLMEALTYHSLLERMKPRKQGFSDDQIKDMERVMCLALQHALLVKPVEGYGFESPVRTKPKEQSYLNFRSKSDVARVATVSSMVDG